MDKKKLAMAVLVMVSVFFCADHIYCGSTEEDHFAQGGAYFIEGDYEKAISEYNKAIEIDPENAEAYFSLGLAQSLLNRNDAARNSLERSKYLFRKKGDEQNVQKVDGVIDKLPK